MGKAVGGGGRGLISGCTTEFAKAGRPKLRWLDCTENGLKSTGVKNGGSKLKTDPYGLSLWRRHWLHCKDRVPKEEGEEEEEEEEKKKMRRRRRR
jgi:hypothetical protein